MTDVVDTIEESEYTTGEFEEMDLSELKGKVFMVAVNNGPQDKCSFVCNTVCGPFDFYEMVEAVGNLYQDEQLHACAFVPGERFGMAPLVLDENTIDFIEARYLDIIADGLLDGSVMEMQKFTCKAGFIKEEPEVEQAESE